MADRLGEDLAEGHTGSDAAAGAAAPLQGADMTQTAQAGDILIGGSAQPQRLRLDRANRHGLVAGATGTGKTVTLQILAQRLSDAGVPVFAADVKGDLSGVADPGEPGTPEPGGTGRRPGRHASSLTAAAHEKGAGPERTGPSCQMDSRSSAAPCGWSRRDARPRR
jgi:hypothetical protein